MYSYGVTQQGTYHVKHNIVCQDYHYIEKVNDDIIIAAVADGLGSETSSDVASKIAAIESVKFCVTSWIVDGRHEDYLSLIERAFTYALEKINERVVLDNGDVNQYDTTLCLSIFMNDKVYWGQSGDSGAVVLTTDGYYESITKQQRDENGCVYPLAFGKEKWEFGYKTQVASVLMATDGMLETLFPVLLRSEPVNIYVALARFLMDRDVLDFENNGEQAVSDKMFAFMNSIPDNQVNDDKTIVALVNAKLAVKHLDDAYYEIPNWSELQRKRQEEFNRLAYPHLYSDSTIASSSTIDNAIDKVTDETVQQDVEVCQSDTGAKDVEVSSKKGILEKLQFRKKKNE